ncbi:MAG TPA: hypothetical protein VK173_07810 [Lacibacter sp.]|nr:hypothetical protein [Lacibacter sp.]
MARAITDIQNEIIAQVQANATLAPLLTSTSKVAVWRLLTYVVAVCIWTLEKLFDIHVIDVNETISKLKPHSLRWYAEKARAFQYGYNLVDDADYYDNTGIDDATIEASQVVAYAAVVEQERGLRIKVARDTGDLAALTSPQLTAFIEYMKRVKDAGVRLNITSTAADGLKLTLEIYYNPLVLNSTGARLDGAGAEPVQDAVKNYLKNLPFNGVFVLQSLIDQLQVVDGVKIAHLVSAQAQYGLLPYQSFAVKYLPDSGYLRLINPGDLVLTFIPYSE